VDLFFIIWDAAAAGEGAANDAQPKTKASARGDLVSWTGSEQRTRNRESAGYVSQVDERSDWGSCISGDRHALQGGRPGQTQRGVPQNGRGATGQADPGAGRSGVPRNGGPLPVQSLFNHLRDLTQPQRRRGHRQQVFAKIYFSIGKFDFRSSLLTWIYKITVNECYDYLRKKKVRKLVYESDFGDDETSGMERSEADSTMLADERLAKRDLVLKLLSKISQEDRQLMLLKEVEGHSVEELAQMMGMNENTIKVKLFRARQKLLKAAQRLTGRKPIPPAEMGN